MGENFIIKTMTHNEVDFAVDLAAKEGWNPGLNDASPFYNCDPSGFLIGYLNNKPIGCISAVSYENKFGFIGFYIIIPEMRGKGFGMQLWNAAMNKLADHNIGLDGVIAQQENYKKSGFKLAYSNIRFEWINQPTECSDSKIVDAHEIEFDDIKEYDREFFSADRSAFLKEWLMMPGSTSYVYKDEDVIKGYGVIRKCRTGYKIGPLFSETVEIAENIFLKLTHSVPAGSPIYLDVPETNEEGISFALTYGMKKVFGTARMYTGDFPDLPIDKIFGVTTFELG